MYWYNCRHKYNLAWFHIFPVTYSYCISREICHETIAFLTTCLNRLQQPSDDDDNVVVVKSIIKNSVITWPLSIYLSPAADRLDVRYVIACYWFRINQVLWSLALRAGMTLPFPPPWSWSDMYRLIDSSTVDFATMYSKMVGRAD